MLEFKSFSKIPRLKNVHCRITQKLDGTNGVIAIDIPTRTKPNDTGEIEFKVGSRNQWLSSPEEIKLRGDEIAKWREQRCRIDLDRRDQPEKLHDNHGFAKWAYENKEALMEFLGEGYHYGEWCGPGIQNGEGLKEKGFYLFSPISRYIKEKGGLDYDKASLNIYSKGLHFVPELYNDKLDGRGVDELIQDSIDELICNGSKIGDGSIKPEGLIVELNMNTKFKIVLNESEKAKRGVK